ncbi:MAG: peptidylprolyl isomerase [Asticcacaulis sp.]
MTALTLSLKASLALALSLGLSGATLAATPKAKPAKAEAAKAEAVMADLTGYVAADPENTWVIDTSKGRVIVELRPDLAPLSVERIKKLTREKFYDGLKFHRVIDGFMAQTGDPLGTGEGQSSYEDVKGEFTLRRDSTFPMVRVAAPRGSVAGVVGITPVMTQPDALMAMTKDNKVHAWGLFCQGVAGMARAENPDSANSQFFLMRDTNPALDKRYTVFGRVISGLEVVRTLKVGEPVENPDIMVRARILADIPAAEAPKVMVMDTRSLAFRNLVDKMRKDRGADFSVCDIDIPARVN